MLACSYLLAHTGIVRRKRTTATSSYVLLAYSRFNLASGSSFEELKNLYEEVVHTIIIPSLLHLDNVAFFMGKIVCKAFRASYPLLVYGHLYGREGGGRTMESPSWVGGKKEKN